MNKEDFINEFRAEIKECDESLDELCIKVDELNKELDHIEHDIVFVEGRRYMAETFLCRMGDN